jgi:hypothetical protein
MSDQSDQQGVIRDGAEVFLEYGEEVISTLRAAPRGRPTATAVGLAGDVVGQDQVRRVHGSTGRTGISVASPMALVLTQRRLLTLGVGATAATGRVSEVNGVLSAVELGDVDLIQARRLGLGAILTLAVAGGPAVKLGCGVGPARAFVEAFNLVKTGR